MLINLQVLGEEVQIDSEDLIPLSNVIDMFTKAKSRSRFAFYLVEKLFDEETRVKSNVRGKGKEQLDPTIMAYGNVIFGHLVYLLHTFLGGLRRSAFSTTLLVRLTRKQTGRNVYRQLTVKTVV